ncbi:MAG: hypothetical protein J5379_06070 [Clostridiales bacterium]|nr:hypothetical protein [Clostridiales bacterium]
MIRQERRVSKKKIGLLLSLIIMMYMLSGCLSLLLPKMKVHEYTVVTNSQQLFILIYDTLYRFEEEVYVQTTSYKEFMSFWLELDGQFALHSAFRENDVQLQYKEQDGVCKTDILMKLNPCGQAMQYLYAKNVKKYPSKEAEEVGEKLIAIRDELISDKLDEQQRVMKIHDYLITHCAYAVNGDSKYYSSTQVLLDEGKAMCQGYAEAFCALCLLSNLECKVISGNSTFGFGEGAHAWCQVRVGYIWYHIDVTWDDPIPDEPGMIRYDFYLKGDSMMHMTHEWCPYYEECFADYAY